MTFNKHPALLPYRLRSALWWAAMVVVLWGAWRQYGGLGLALAFSMLAFWLTIQFSQMMRVMSRAAQQPKGQVAHAMKLHVKLKTGQRLMQVIGMTGSLGELVSAAGEQPEVYRWHDAQGDLVEARFVDGRLLDHRIERASAGSANGAPTDGATEASDANASA